MFTEHPLLPFYPPEGALEAGLDLNGSALPPSEGPPGPRNQPNTALLSLILMLGTFLIAFFLRKFRNSRFLGGKVHGCWEWGMVSPWTYTKSVHPYPHQKAQRSLIRREMPAWMGLAPMGFKGTG